MAYSLKRIALRSIPYLFSDSVGLFLARRWTKGFMKPSEMMADEFLELLLSGMDLAFCLSRGYRENIKDFEGRYLFVTSDGEVAAGATFKDGDMEVHKEAIDDWDIKVTFKDADAFWEFIFSKDQDILNSILKNDVEVDGNLNYLYKFGFMARDLGYRLGVG